MTRKSTKEGRKTPIGSWIALRLYGLTQNPGFRWLLRRLVLRMEGGGVYSLNIREIFRRFHGVDVGLYTVGPCEVEPGNLAPGTAIGRYSSIYYTVRTIACDYPVSTNFPDGLVSDAALGKVSVDVKPRTKLVIGNDVFMGHNAIVLPTVREIGDGAIIGAGSVIHSDLPPYAVVTGNPARVVRFRFSKEKIKELLEAKWWLKGIDELSHEMEDFRKPVEGVGPVR